MCENKEKQENAKLGYQAAVSLWVYEGQLLWSKYNVMIVVNTLFITACILAMKEDLHILTYVIPILGFILCFGWLIMAARGFAYHKFWVLSARKLEEDNLSNPVITASKGAQLAEGGHVSFDFNNDKSEEIKLNWLFRRRAKHIYYATIIMFKVIYVLVFIEVLLDC